MNSLEQTIFQITSDALQILGFNIVTFKMGNDKIKQLHFTIERMDYNPVTVVDCKNASRHIETLLSVEGVLDNFAIEMSSPGVERPLLNLNHYKKYVGQEVKIQLINAIDNKKIYVGVIDIVVDDNIILKVDQQSNAVMSIDFVSIKKANLVFSDELFRKLINQSTKD